MELGRSKECIYRICEQYSISGAKQLLRLSKILFKRLYPLAGMQYAEFMLRILSGKIVYRLQGNAVFTFGAAVYHCYLHGSFSLHVCFAIDMILHYWLA